MSIDRNTVPVLGFVVPVSDVRKALCTVDNYRVNASGDDVCTVAFDSVSVEVVVDDDLALAEACEKLFDCACDVHGDWTGGDDAMISFERIAAGDFKNLSTPGECDGGWSLAAIAGATPGLVLIGQRLARAGIDPGEPGVYTVTTIS